METSLSVFLVIFHFYTTYVYHSQYFVDKKFIHFYLYICGNLKLIISQASNGGVTFGQSRTIDAAQDLPFLVEKHFFS